MKHYNEFDKKCKEMFDQAVELAKKFDLTLILEEKASEEDKPAYTEETKLTDLTVAQLKALLTPVVPTQQKDIREVVVLAYVLDELSYFIQYFENNQVNQGSIDKLKQALALVLEVVKDQAELDKKELPVDFVVNKIGRTISGKHEELLNNACEHMKNGMDCVKTVLESVAEEDNDGGSQDEGGKQARPSASFYKRLARQLKTTDKQVGLALRLLNSQKRSSV